MNINKAQGQTIPYIIIDLPQYIIIYLPQYIIIYLPQDALSHGQLYVALSHGTSVSTTKVLIKYVTLVYGVMNSSTKNVML